jgi:hypothetical protein
MLRRRLCLAAEGGDRLKPSVKRSATLGYDGKQLPELSQIATACSFQHSVARSRGLDWYCLADESTALRCVLGYMLSSAVADLLNDSFIVALCVTSVNR